MKKPNNFDDYMDKLNKVKLSPERQNLPPVDQSLTLEQMINLAVKEGNELLEAEAKKAKRSVKKADKEAAKKLETALGEKSNNPYIRARIQVLQKMSTFLRHEIEEMEKTGNLDNRYYADFVKEVRMLGDSLAYQDENGRSN